MMYFNNSKENNLYPYAYTGIQQNVDQEEGDADHLVEMEVAT